MRFNLIVTGGVAMLALGNAGHLRGQSRPTEKVLTCDTISLGRPGEGVAYRDGFTNDDYHFSATIPAGLTGWGSGPGAPFHGFTIYLNKNGSEMSCIHLLIGIHVDLPEDLPTNFNPEGTKRVKVGGRVGLQKLTQGIVHGVGFENVQVSLELPRSGYQDDVTITLVTPTGEKSRTVPIFERFISQLRFR